MEKEKEKAIIPDLSQRLEQLREKMGWSKDTIAKHMGLASGSGYTAVLNGAQSRANAFYLLKDAEKNLNLNWLLTGYGEMFGPENIQSNESKRKIEPADEYPTFDPDMKVMVTIGDMMKMREELAVERSEKRQLQNQNTIMIEKFSETLKSINDHLAKEQQTTPSVKDKKSVDTQHKLIMTNQQRSNTGQRSTGADRVPVHDHSADPVP